MNLKYLKYRMYLNNISVYLLLKWLLINLLRVQFELFKMKKTIHEIKSYTTLIV